MCSHHHQAAHIDFDYPSIASGNTQAFAQYCEYFYNPTFKIISRFTGITNPDILSLLTESVFLHLWGNRDDFLNYNSGWLFRTTIQVTTRFLKDHGHHERVQKILDLIDNERILRAIMKHKNGSHEPGNP